MTESKHQELLRKLRELRLPGFLQAYTEQHDDEPTFVDMPFGDRLALIVDAEWNERHENRTERLAKQAGLPMQQARFSELDDCRERSFNRKTLNTLRTNDYIRMAHNVIITGAAGSGKTYISNMLGNNACADGFHVHYATAPELYEDLAACGIDNTRRASAKHLLKADLVIVDEFLLTRPTETELYAVYNLMMERTRKRSIIFCSHYAFEGWYERMGGGVLVESILDRLHSAAYMIAIVSSISMRERYEKITSLTPEAITETSE